MTHFWKISTFILLISCLGLIFYILQDKSKRLSPNEISLKNIEKDPNLKNQETNPEYSEINQDYFYKNETNIEFLSDLYDYDTIIQGENVTKVIEFKNNGSHPFFITDIKVTCGCTVPSYEKEPTAPGGIGKIHVEYRSKNKEGFSMNRLSVYGNVKGGEKSAYFKVYVRKK